MEPTTRLRLSKWQQELLLKTAKQHMKKSDLQQIDRRLQTDSPRLTAEQLRLAAQALFPTQAAFQCQLNSTPMPSKGFAATFKQGKRCESLRFHLLSRAAWLESKSSEPPNSDSLHHQHAAQSLRLDSHHEG